MNRYHAAIEFVRESMWEIVLLAVVAALIAGVALAYAPARTPVASSETRFVEVSASGLYIVPASCPSVPSNPDYPHDTCSNPTCPNSFQYNSILRTCVPTQCIPDQSICVGNDRYLNSLILLCNGLLGSQTPLSCATDPCTQTFIEHCSLACSNGQCTSVQCPAPRQIINGTCQCPSGTWDGSQCVSGSGECPAPRQIINGSCQCPSGTWDGSQCVVSSSSCPAPRQIINGTCQCPSGTWDGSQCVPSSITFVPFTGTTPSGPPFDFGATGHLQVRPLLVRSGETVRVYWNVENAEWCSVTSSNPSGNSWLDTFSSGTTGKTSSPIEEQTVFMLYCEALPEATPSSITETKTVNIIPIFEEL